MDLQLEDKVCLITGAGGGIGQATAVALAREGARVVVTARTVTVLAPVLQKIASVGGRDAIAIAADLVQPSGATMLADQVLAATGRVDVLVNNAGASWPDPRDDAEWADAMQLNFAAPRQLAERFIPGMTERRWGRIINLTGAIVAKEFNAAGAAKAALESWSKAAAGAHGARGITVNCVAPGRIDSVQIREKLYPTEEARRAYIAQNIPAGRFGEAEEAAALVAFLVSGPASYVNGVTVPVDGGALRYAF